MNEALREFEDRLESGLTAEWLQCFEEAKGRGEILAESIFWRLAIHHLPLGVNPRDARVKAALEEIRASVEARKQ